MRKILKLFKFVGIGLVLFLIFYQLWLPFTYPKIEGLLLSNISASEPSVQALTAYNPTAASSESLGTLDLNDSSRYESGSSIVTTDTRIIAMRRFLIDYRSPLYPYADVFVNEADKYGLDWRLVASISGVESAFGNLIPYGSNNAWGWKGDPRRPWSMFPTWPDGIRTVTSRLALGYGTELTPFEIEPTYCPPCGRNPAHAWANGVTRFMNLLDEYEQEI